MPPSCRWDASSDTHTWNLNRNETPVPDALTSCVRPTVPIEETKPRLCSTTSWGSDSEGAGSLSRNSQIYFSTKARVSFRHQLDSNINAVDATYWAPPDSWTAVWKICLCPLMFPGLRHRRQGAWYLTKLTCSHMTSSFWCAQPQFTY